MHRTGGPEEDPAASRPRRALLPRLLAAGVPLGAPLHVLHAYKLRNAKLHQEFNRKLTVTVRTRATRSTPTLCLVPVPAAIVSAGFGPAYGTVVQLKPQRRCVQKRETSI